MYVFLCLRKVGLYLSFGCLVRYDLDLIYSFYLWLGPCLFAFIDVFCSVGGVGDLTGILMIA